MCVWDVIWYRRRRRHRRLRMALPLAPSVVHPMLKVVGNVPRRNSVNSSKFLLLACHRSSLARRSTAACCCVSLSSRSVAASHWFTSASCSRQMSASYDPDCGANANATRSFFFKTGPNPAIQLYFTVFSFPRTLLITLASKSKRCSWVSCALGGI